MKKEIIVDLIKPNYKEFIKEINKLEPNLDTVKFLDFFKRDLILYIYSYDKNEAENFLDSVSPNNVLIKFVDLDSLKDKFNEIIYNVKLHNQLGDYIYHLCYIFFSINIVSSYMVSNSYKERVPHIVKYQGDKGYHILLTNNKLCLENDRINHNYINSIINKLKKKYSNKSSKRTPLTKSIRLEVLKRDNYKCLACGNDEKLEIDHIIPYSDGGTDEISNLQTLCKFCNISKSNRRFNIEK